MFYRPKFTIWVINYNKPDLTLMTLRSIRTKHICDVGLVNTGEAPDKHKYREIYELVDIACNYENESLAKTWNWIMKKSCTEWNFIFNNDVLLSEYTIENLWKRKRAAGVVSCVDISGKMPIDKSILPHLYVLDEWPGFGRLEFDKGLEVEADFSGFLLSKNIWRQVGGFNEKYKIAYFEDLDFKQRLWNAGIKYCGVKAAPFYHIGQASSDQNAHRTKYYARNHATYLKIWGDKANRINAGGLAVKRATSSKI